MKKLLSLTLSLIMLVTAAITPTFTAKADDVEYTTMSTNGTWYEGYISDYKPSTVSILSVKASKSKKITIKWKKTTCTGYQIQYSTSSKFKNAKSVTVNKSGTTSKTISKLKAKKKYYVRVRAYKTVDGKKYYGSWSKVKSVTIKK